MRLLIITQVIDVNHPILGFFHRWVEEFAKNCEHVHVIALQVGKHNLPTNVTIHSLGKEDGMGKFRILRNFFQLIWRLRSEYDHVFVHMNQIYVILGAPFWRALGKKIGLWYAHGTVSRSLKIAEKFTDYIFTASGDSFKLKSKKVQVTGHGIDTKLFLPKSINKDIDLITVGRITSSKNLFALVDILEEIRKADDVALTIVGVGVTSEEKEYEAKLKSYVKEKKLSQFVHFLGRVEQVNLPDILNRARVFVTTAKNGSLDKAILEPMACGLPVVSMAKGSTSLPLGANQVTTKAEFATQTHKVLESKDFMIQDYVEYINTNHSLQSLVPNINETYAS